MSAIFEGAVVKSVSIENLLAQRDGVLQRVNQAIGLLLEAKEISNTARITDPATYRTFDRILQGDDRYRGTDLMEEKALEQVRKRLDARAWDYLMSESGLRSLMDAKARTEWGEKIAKLECPELTADNIRATFSALHGSRGEIFERGVINCFKGLSWSYKTNRPFAFGKRLVVTYLRSSVTGPGSSLGYPNSRSCDSLDDLMRVFSVIDGKPEPDHRNGIYNLIGASRTAAERDVENDYLKIRSFRNGNGHVTFKRPDLVERMNKILSKHYPNQLPADRHERAREFEEVRVS